jgi:hypothetical protein
VNEYPPPAGNAYNNPFNDISIVELDTTVELFVVPIGNLEGGTYIDPDIYILYNHIYITKKYISKSYYKCFYDMILWRIFILGTK